MAAKEIRFDTDARKRMLRGVDILFHEVISEEGHGRCFANGFTYSGHPVACAAALKNIEIMERENLFSNVAEVGPYFEEQLKTLMDLDIVGDVRGAGHQAADVNIGSSAEYDAVGVDQEDITVGGQNAVAKRCVKPGDAV